MENCWLGDGSCDDLQKAIAGVADFARIWEEEV